MARRKKRGEYGEDSVRTPRRVREPGPADDGSPDDDKRDGEASQEEASEEESEPEIDDQVVDWFTYQEKALQKVRQTCKRFPRRKAANG